MLIWEWELVISLLAINSWLFSITFPPSSRYNFGRQFECWTNCRQLEQCTENRPKSLEVTAGLFTTTPYCKVVIEPAKQSPVVFEADFKWPQFGLRDP